MHWVAPSEKDADNPALERRLTDAAEQTVPAPIPRLKSQEYAGGRPQGPVLGLIFLRFAEDRCATQRAKLESPSPLGARERRVGGPGLQSACPVPSSGTASTRTGGEGARRVSRGSRVDEPFVLAN